MALRPFKVRNNNYEFKSHVSIVENYHWVISLTLLSSYLLLLPVLLIIKYFIAYANKIKI